MATLAPVTRQRFFDSSGNPLSGGKVQTFEAGTSAEKTTWTDEAKTVPHANPIILDSEGYAPNPIYLDGLYKLVYFDSSDVQLYEDDNIDPTGVGDDISKNYLTLSEAVADTTLVNGDKGRAAGYGDFEIVNSNPDSEYVAHITSGLYIKPLGNSIAPELYNETKWYETPENTPVKTHPSDNYIEAGIGQAFMMKIRHDIEDANLLIMGDSTSNETTEWAYILTQWIGTKFPTHTVNYYLWAGTDYGTATVISTGSGSNVINVYNASISGARVSHFLGSKRDNMYAGKRFDLALLSYGHNGASSEIVDRTFDRFMEAIPQYMQDLPYTEFALILQNLNKEDQSRQEYSARVADAAEKAAGILGIQTIKIRETFLQKDADGTFTEWMKTNDLVHPNEVGSKVWSRQIQMALENPVKQASAKNLILNKRLKSNADNPFFSIWPTADSSPTGWTLTNCTAERDTSDADSLAYSVKLTSTDAVTGNIAKVLTDFLTYRRKGTPMMIAARIKVPSANGGDNAGRIEVTSSVSSLTTDTRTDILDGWHWRILTVPSSQLDTATTLKASVLTGSSTGSDILKIDRIYLGEGLEYHDVEWDGIKQILAEYYFETNVHATDDNDLTITNGNDIALVDTQLDPGRMWIDINYLEIGQSYTATWTSADTGVAYIRTALGGGGSNQSGAPTPAFTAGSLQFTATLASQSLLFVGGGGVTDFSIDDVTITKD